MKDFERSIEMLKNIDREKTMSLVDFAKLYELVCEEFGRQRVVEALAK